MASLRKMAEMIDLHQGAVDHLKAAERLIAEAHVLGCWEITGSHGPSSASGLLAALGEVRREVARALDMIADKTPTSV